jgi:serine/threonine protein kinase
MLSEKTRRYVKGKQLGSGAYGAVFDAIRDDGKIFAFKEYNSRGMDIDVGALREISALKMIGGMHNIINIEDIILEIKGDEKPTLGIVMQKYSSDLYKLIQENTITLGQKLIIAEKLIESVCFLHKNSIMHRDIKPENILINTDNEPVLADFTLAKVFRGIHAYGSHTGKIATVFYRAPEVHSGERYSFSSDCWSLGMVLYELFNGYSLPYGLENIEMYIKANNRRFWNTTHGKLVCKMLENNPSKRMTAKEALNYPLFSRAREIKELELNVKKRIVTDEVKEICNLLHTTKPITFLAAQIYKEETECLAEYAVELAFKFYETEPYEIEMEEYYHKELEILKRMNFNLFV